jgi:isopenicillin N synthase-like dioxygenase
MSYAEAARIDADAIPVIDLAGLAEGTSLDRVGRAMLAAAEGVGFFYIRNHGVPAGLIADVLRVAGAFFAAPMAEKERVAVAAGHRGFIRMGEAKMASGARPDLKESFVWGLDEPGDDGIPPNRWPNFMPEMRGVLTAFFDAGNALGWQMLRAFAVAIDVAPDRFVQTIGRPISRGSVIYYPPQPPEMGAEQFGVSAHTDYGCLTLLHQDETGGLQVQGRDGAWLMAAPIPGTFVVNVGDLLARWTNDRFRSTPHRVVNRSGRTRLSTAIFVDPNRDTLIEPVVRAGEVARYEPVTCGDYLRGRLDAAFAYRRAAGG